MNFQMVFNENSKVRRKLSFISSGYGIDANKKRYRKEDIFFFDFDLIGRPKTKFISQVFQEVISDLRKDLQFVLLNDNSSEYHYLKRELDSQSVRFIEHRIQDQVPLDKKLAELSFHTFGLDSIELFNFLSLGVYFQKPILCPRFYFRVVNAAYGSSNPSYWVYVENERYHIFDQLCQELNVQIIWNFYRCHSDFYFHFFDHRLETFLLNHQGRDIALFEREQLKALGMPSNKFSAIPVSNDFDKLAKDYFRPTRMAQSAFPLHCLYKKMRSETLLNRQYLELYDL